MKALLLNKKSIMISFIFSLLVIGLVRFNQDISTERVEKSIKRLLSSTGHEACDYVNFEIDDGSIKTKGTTDAFSYLHSVRPVNKLLTPLESNESDDWDAYMVSLIPLFLPFFIVSIICFLVWLGCVGQIIFKNCCRCCERDLYRNPYTSSSIFWCMIATTLTFILCLMAATVNIIQLEYSYKGYQQLHCQGYQIFEHFINGNEEVQNWIGIKDFGNKMVAVQNQIASNINDFNLLFENGQNGQTTESMKSDLYNYINTIFDEFKTVEITNPSPTTSNPNNLLLDSYIQLEVKGFDNIKSKILADYNSVIINISSLLDFLKTNVQSLDTNSSTNTQFIQEKKALIDEFTVSFKKAQSNANDLFEKGNNYLYWYRVSLLIILGIVLFCCLFSFVVFIMMYFYRVKYLEHFINFIWILTSLAVIAGFFAAGIVYTTTIVFYEGSLSLDSFLTSETSYNRMSYILDADAAKYTQNCIFSSAASMGFVFGLTDYLNNVNNISKYIKQNEEAFGGLEYPNISINTLIEDCSDYMNDIGTLASTESSAKLSILNSCISGNNCVCDQNDPSTTVKCSQVLLKDKFVFGSTSCSSDELKRFILKKGQETQNLDLMNCIFIAIDELDSSGQTTVSNNMNYQQRLNQVNSVDTTTQCTTLQSCSLTHRDLLIKYASQAGKNIQAVQNKLKKAQDDFIHLYQSYYSQFKQIKEFYQTKLETQILIVSDADTGIYTNTECTAFGNDLKTMQKYLTNQFIFEMYTLDWWTISTFVGMMAGLFFMYFTISRLQYWANLEGQNIDDSPNNNTNRLSNDKPLLQANITPKKVIMPINNNSSIINESQLKSQLINQSAYNKKYVTNRGSAQQSTNNFQYQVSLTDISQFESPAKFNLTSSQYQPYTKSQYELEMENYHN